MWGMQIMGGKRKEKIKMPIKLSIDADLYEQLMKDGVNKSRLFSVLSKKYLRRKYGRKDF